MPSNKKLLQAAAGSAGGDPLYVEDVFSTYLYDGNSSTNVITNGIDLAGEGGLVWGKSRDNAFSHMLIDTVRGGDKGLSSNATSAEYDNNTMITSFNSNGFTLGSYLGLNYNGDDVVSWSFRKAEKFFDVVTYTGTGSERTVSHSLGSVPRIMIIKRTNGTGGWWVYSKDWVDANSGSLGVALNLSNTDAGLTGYDTDFFWGANPTDSVFSVGTYGGTNGNNDTYVAYLFASDAGGFGDDGSESIIKCGSYVGNGTYTQFQNLGFEPQWILFKNASAADDWWIYDSMRGLVVGGPDNRLATNLSSAEVVTGSSAMSIAATGFTPNAYSTSGQTYIYIAIRRPMKTPESGTEVFQALTYSGTGTFPNGTDPNSGVATRTISSSLGFDVDMSITKWRSGGSGTPAPSSSLMDRFRGIYNELLTYDGAAETQGSNTGPRFSTRASRAFDLHDYGVEQLNKSGQALVSYVFKRATGFFDMVAYSGTGNFPQNVTHNLTVTPEMMIVKYRDGASNWYVYHSALGNTKICQLDNDTASSTSGSSWNNTSPTATQFTVGSLHNYPVAGKYIAYLFASLAGVSKVGSYTGTAADLNVDCGFSAGARFILIKRTDSTGDWYVWDSERGIVAGNDPYLLLNSTAAEVTSTDYIDPLSSGFTVTSSAPAALNASGGTYLFMAIS